MDPADFLNKAIEEERNKRVQAEAMTEQTKRDMAALISEFTNANDEDSVEKIKKNIRGRIPQALTTLDELMLTGSDSIKAGIAKWFVDRGLAPTEDGSLSGEAAKLNKLLEKLQ